MSAIINFSINLEAIPKELIIKGKKGSYVNLTAFANDETKYGNNASVALAQSIEQREAGEQKTYIGNGKVVWVSDEGVSVAEREEDIAQEQSATAHNADADDDLPF